MPKYADLTPEERAEHDAAQASGHAAETARIAEENRKRAALAAALRDVPANVNSVPALRDRVQAIVVALRDLLGVEIAP